MSTSKETETWPPPPPQSILAEPVPVPPSALYSKSGYLEMPSLQFVRDLK